MSAALHLQAQGHRVRVFDPRAPGTATSFGNAGGVVTGAVMPTSTPGLWKDVPAMLFDPMGPLRIRWRYLPRLMPWLVRFLRAGNPARVEAIARALGPLVARAYEAHRELARRVGAEDILHAAGWLKLYATEQSFAASQRERDLMSRCGAHFEVLAPADVAALEPGLARRYAKGLFQPQSGFVANPGRLVRRYAEHFASAGGNIVPAAVRGLHAAGGDTLRMDTELGIHALDLVVVAAGAWSARIAAGLGDRIPLDAERGYHLNIEAGTAALRRPVFFVDQRLVLAPMEDGIRLTSGVELAGLEAPPDFTRIRRLLPVARELLPGLSANVTREWMGHRPSTPDSLPVVGCSARHPNVIYAFGHGHLGLTLGPLTGRLVAQIAAGRDAEVDLSPYRPGRF